MNTLSPAYKWLVGIAVIAFIGLGTWLGVLVYRSHQKSATASVATQLPAPVANGLIQPQPETAPVTTSVPASASTAKPAAKPAAKTSQTETALAVSMTNVSMNGQVTITLVANQPIVAGFGPLGSASDFAMVKTLTVASFSGSKTVVARTKSGQTQTFTVSGSSSSGANASTSVSSASSQS